MTKELESIRKQLAILAGRKSARTTEWTRGCPTEWQPTKVIDPRTDNDSPFTPDGAWDFVVQKLLDPEMAIQEVRLSNPADKKGYVLHVDTDQGPIYIKVQFGNGGKIIGRSFHYESR